MRESERDPPASSGYLYYAVGLLTLVNLVNYMDRTALSVLMPAIKADLALSDSELGLLIGLAFSLFYGICGIPIARMADRGSRKRIIVAALAVWSVMTALSGAAQNYWQLLGARIGVGAGEAGCLPPSQSMMSDYFPPSKRPLIFATLTVGLFLGTMAGIIAAGWLETKIGWRWTFAALGIPGLLLAFIVAITLREPPRGYFDPPLDQGARHAPAIEALRTLAANGGYRVLLLCNVGIAFVQGGFLQWIPSFCQRIFGVPIAEFSLTLGLAIGLGSAFGLVVGGWGSNRAALMYPGRAFRLGAIAYGLAMTTALSALFAPTLDASLIFIALTCALWNVPVGKLVAEIQGAVAPTLRATASAVVILAVAILGHGLAPFLVGAASDLLTAAQVEGALRFALLVPVAAFPLTALILLRLARMADTHSIALVPHVD